MFAVEELRYKIIKEAVEGQQQKLILQNQKSKKKFAEKIRNIKPWAES